MPNVSLLANDRSLVVCPFTFRRSSKKANKCDTARLLKACEIAEGKSSRSRELVEASERTKEKRNS